MSITFYTEVDPNGYVSRSMFTTSIEGYNPPSGWRLLPDNPPNPPQYISGVTYPVRIEPVPLDATEIPYKIVEHDKAPSEIFHNDEELASIIKRLTE